MRISTRLGLAIAFSAALPLVHADCTANSSTTDDLQRLLTDGGAGYKLSLCAGQTYNLDKILNYTAVGQVSDHPKYMLSCRKSRPKDIHATARERRCSSADST